MFGRRCLMCGLYIKFWQKRRHESWHAEQIVQILKLLCPMCATWHGRMHEPCGKNPDCRCVCNAFGGDPE
jgi:hypothetical protein